MFTARQGVGTSATYTAEGFICAVPRIWAGDGTRRCLVSIRGADLSYTVSLRDVQAAADAGFPCIAADYGQTSGGRWGTGATEPVDTLARITAAWTYMKTNFGVATDKLMFGTGSGGTIDALQWAADNPSNVSALYGVAPCIDLEFFRDGDYDSRQSEIDTRWGGTAAFQVAMATRNPFDRYAAVAGIRQRYWYSDDDPLCPPANHAVPFAAAVGANADAISGGANGHSVPGLTFADDGGPFLEPYATA